MKQLVAASEPRKHSPATPFGPPRSTPQTCMALPRRRRLIQSSPIFDIGADCRFLWGYCLRIAAGLSVIYGGGGDCAVRWMCRRRNVAVGGARSDHTAPGETTPGSAARRPRGSRVRFPIMLPDGASHAERDMEKKRRPR